jgi:hypothetical protein
MKLKSITIAAIALSVGLIISPAAVNAAVTYFSLQTKVSAANAVNCPTGYKVSGGGVSELPSNSNSGGTKTEYLLRGSWPTTNGWAASARRLVITQSGLSVNVADYAQNVTVWAICIK